jgi:DNA gyrase subunit A
VTAHIPDKGQVMVRYHNLRITPNFGHALGMVGINEEDLLVITVEGKVIGIPTDKVWPLSRATQGVRIINLDDKDRVCSIAKVREE